MEFHHTKNPIISLFILNLSIFWDKVYNNFKDFFNFKKISLVLELFMAFGLDF
jgi:hypothetical protein